MTDILPGAIVFVWVSDGAERSGKIKSTVCHKCGVLVPQKTHEIHLAYHRKLDKL